MGKKVLKNGPSICSSEENINYYKITHPSSDFIWEKNRKCRRPVLFYRRKLKDLLTNLTSKAVIMANSVYLFVQKVLRNFESCTVFSFFWKFILMIIINTHAKNNYKI